ncbi:MAG: sensor histidine kinase [Betaproteobacteria bacterium]
MAAQPSLHFLLLRRLLPAMLVVLAAGAAASYWIALRSTNLAYDRSLLNTALALAGQVRIADGYPVLQLTPQAQAILTTDKYDRIFYAVRAPDGELIGGNYLPFPANITEKMETDRYYLDSIWDGRPVRIVVLRADHEGFPVTVLVAETLSKRNAIMRDVILGMVLPELLLVAATIVLIGLGVRYGLLPLTSLQRQLAGRSQADLSPITVAVPKEMQPLVGEINSLLRRLDKSLASQRHFVSDAAHQLRTPIAALQAQVEAALRQSTPDSRDCLKSILSAAQRLSHLVSQLLALARAEPGHSEPPPIVPLKSVICEAAEAWVPSAIERNIDLGFDIGEGSVRGNGLLLRELMNNLVVNALRHTPNGGTVTVSCGTEGDHVWLAVDDSGPGIPESEREKVFERFYQPADSGSDGCGLGLAIVQAIAQQHGGKASMAMSDALGGARAEVRLPAATSGEAG